MPRKSRPLDRDNGAVRDARLIVIASEDTHAVEVYFKQFRTMRVQFRVLPTENGRSSPQHILERLDEYRKEFEIGDEDQLWYCGDTDHWIESSHIDNLTLVLTHCRTNGYWMALSNPCFELWLLLHFVDVQQGEGITCSVLRPELSKRANGYSRQVGCATPLTADMVHSAIARAKSLPGSHEAIPLQIGTAVYRILEELLAREAIELHLEAEPA